MTKLDESQISSDVENSSKTNMIPFLAVPLTPHPYLMTYHIQTPRQKDSNFPLSLLVTEFSCRGQPLLKYTAETPAQQKNKTNCSLLFIVFFLFLLTAELEGHLSVNLKPLGLRCVARRISTRTECRFITSIAQARSIKNSDRALRHRAHGCTFGGTTGQLEIMN